MRPFYPEPMKRSMESDLLGAPAHSDALKFPFGQQVYRVRVVAIYDADCVQVIFKHRDTFFQFELQILGIETAERHGGGIIKSMGDAALEYARDLLMGTNTLHYAVFKRYASYPGGILGHLMLDATKPEETNYGRILLATGLAVPYSATMRSRALWMAIASAWSCSNIRSMDPIHVDQDIRAYPFGVEGWTWEMWDKAKADHPEEHHSLFLEVNGSRALTEDEYGDQGGRFCEARVDMEDPIEPLCYTPWTSMTDSMSEACKIRNHLSATTSLLNVHVQIHREKPKWRAMYTIKKHFMESIQHLCHSASSCYYVEDTCVHRIREIMHTYNDRLEGQATITVLLCKLL